MSIPLPATDKEVKQAFDEACEELGINWDEMAERTLAEAKADKEIQKQSAEIFDPNKTEAERWEAFFKYNPEMRGSDGGLILK